MKKDFRIDRRNFLYAAGGTLAGVAIAASVGESPAHAKIEEFCDSYNPEFTHMDAFEVDELYKGPPPPLAKSDSSSVIQQWDGYVPKCTLEDQDTCKNVPASTENIKVVGVYDGIEVQTDKWMNMACEEARKSVESGGGPFGAVILQIDDETNRIIRYWRNHNHVPLWKDPTAHAEVCTIRAACKQLGTFDLGTIKKGKSNLPQKGKTSHCVLYSSAESCSMCYSAIFWARIATLYFAATKYDAAVQGVNFSDEEIYAELARPYKDRLDTKVYQCTTPISLDAFNLWKRSKKTQY
ncbi:MAG: nucleoside deaminase [Candidatus Dadabacteria bacterium]|nr:nucleoside deaminase [Candidatus Dadabacteria bacterium]